MMPPWNRPAAPAWQKSSYCQGGECAEATKKGDVIALRNSTNPRREVRYSTEEWRSFIQGVKSGEFDHLG